MVVITVVGGAVEGVTGAVGGAKVVTDPDRVGTVECTSPESLRQYAGPGADAAPGRGAPGLTFALGARLVPGVMGASVVAGGSPADG